MKGYQVTILGTADLLQNAFGGKWVRRDDGSGMRPVTAEDGEEDWRRRLYVTEGNTIYQPESHIVGALLRAAGMMRVPGRLGQSYRDILDGGLFVEPIFVPHRVTLADFDAAPTFTGPAPEGFGGLVYIHRRPSPEDPGIMWLRPTLRKGWELAFSILLIDRDFPADVLRAILDLAGCKVGLGDGRPEFGQFAVTRFEAM